MAVKRGAKSDSKKSGAKKVKQKSVFPELPRTLGQHLRHAHLIMWRDFNKNVGHGGLRPGQFTLMDAIERNPGISQIEVSRLIDLDKATVVSLVYTQEKLGWTKRNQAKEDRRRHELFIMPKGKRKLIKIREELKMHDEKFKKLFKSKEYKQLIEMLKRIYEIEDVDSGNL